MFLWPSLAQSPDYNHLSTLEHTRSNLIGREVDVLLCAHRILCGVRCARAKLRIQVSFMDVLLAILVGVAEIQTRGAFPVLSE